MTHNITSTLAVVPCASPDHDLGGDFDAVFDLRDDSCSQTGRAAAAVVVHYAIPPDCPDVAVASARAAWLSVVGHVCEMLHTCQGRGLKTALVGPAAATLSAIYLMRNHNLSAAQVSATHRAIRGFSEASLDAFESILPGRKLVSAPGVQAPVRFDPVLTGTASVAPPMPPMILNPPAPQSGMQFVPVVGAQPGQPVSRPADSRDQRIDAALSLLPGTRPALVGVDGEKPAPIPADQLISVTDGAAGNHKVEGGTP